jgi:TonB family protein
VTSRNPLLFTTPAALFLLVAVLALLPREARSAPRDPGEASNDLLEEVAVIPVDINVPAVRRQAEYGLPREALISVRVRIALDIRGEVVDAEAAEPRLLAVTREQISPEEMSALDGTVAKAFRKAARKAALSSRFSFMNADEIGRDELVRGRVTFQWTTGIFYPKLLGQARRSGSVLVGDCCKEPKIVILVGAGHRHEERFPETDSFEEPRPARGKGRRAVDGTCGWVDALPEGIPLLSPRSEESTGIVAPKILMDTKVQPRYPEDARVLRIGGSVLLKLLVDDQGVPQGAELVRGTPGFPSLAGSALEAVCQWRYEPAREGAAPIRSALYVHIDFSLS